MTTWRTTRWTQTLWIPWTNFRSCGGRRGLPLRAPCRSRTMPISPGRREPCVSAAQVTIRAGARKEYPARVTSRSRGRLPALHQRSFGRDRAGRPAGCAIRHTSNLSILLVVVGYGAQLINSTCASLHSPPASLPNRARRSVGAKRGDDPYCVMSRVQGIPCERRRVLSPA